MSNPRDADGVGANVDGEIKFLATGDHGCVNRLKFADFCSPIWANRILWLNGNAVLSETAHS